MSNWQSCGVIKPFPGMQNLAHEMLKNQHGVAEAIKAVIKALGLLVSLQNEIPPGKG